MPNKEWIAAPSSTARNDAVLVGFKKFSPRHCERLRSGREAIQKKYSTFPTGHEAFTREALVVVGRRPLLRHRPRLRRNR